MCRLEKSAARKKIAELSRSIDVTKYRSTISPRNPFESQDSMQRLSDISSVNLRDSTVKLRGHYATSKLQHLKTDGNQDRSLRVDTETGL